MMPRLRWIVAAAAAHALALLGAPPNSLPGPDSERTLVTQLSPEQLPPPPAPTAAREEAEPQQGPPPDANAAPVGYAGAPPAPRRAEANIEEGLALERSTATAPSPIMARPPAEILERLQRARVLRDDGLRAPAYAVDTIAATVIHRILAAGGGRVVAAEQPLGTGRVFGVRWKATGPARVTVLGSSWSHGLSDRAVELPAQLTAATRRAVERAFGTSPTGLAVFLLLTHLGDSLVLADQMRACEEAGIAVDAVARTRGSFRLGPHGVAGLSVGQLILRDGGRRPVGGGVMSVGLAPRQIPGRTP